MSSIDLMVAIVRQDGWWCVTPRRADVHALFVRVWPREMRRCGGMIKVYITDQRGGKKLAEEWVKEVLRSEGMKVPDA